MGELWVAHRAWRNEPMLPKGLVSKIWLESNEFAWDKEFREAGRRQNANREH